MSKLKDCTLGSEPVVHDFDRFVGEKLRELRNLRNLTRLNLSEILGVSGSLIQQYESGSVRMPLSSVFVLSTSLNVSINYFIEGVDDILPKEKIANDSYVNTNRQKHLNILIIENNAADQLTLVRAIESVHDIKTLLDTVHNVSAALALLRKPNTLLPHIILLNLNLPKMDGIDFIKTLNNDARFRKIPVIVMTNSIKSSDLEKCYQYGVSGYYIKNLDFDNLKSYINISLHYWIINYTA